MHGMGCNCSLQNFSASLCLSAEDSTATVRASSLLLQVSLLSLCAQGQSLSVDSGDALKEKIVDSWAGETEPKGDIGGCRGAAVLGLRRGTSGIQSERAQNPHWAKLGCGSPGAAGQSSDLCPAAQSVWELLSSSLRHRQGDGIGDEELGEGFKTRLWAFFGWIRGKNAKELRKRRVATSVWCGVTQESSAGLSWEVLRKMLVLWDSQTLEGARHQQWRSPGRIWAPILSSPDGDQHRCWDWCSFPSCEQYFPPFNFYFTKMNIMDFLIVIGA